MPPVYVLVVFLCIALAVKYINDRRNNGGSAA